jgi:hypothetical protein
VARSNPPRAAVEQAYAEASRAASRMSLLGALGFGLALVIVATAAREGGPFAAGFGLETILVAGGIGGGIVFTALALRASRIAKECRRRLRG